MFSTWQDKIVPPEAVLAKIKPGMTIFIGSGMAEPRMLVKHLMISNLRNIQDIEIIQLVSIGDTVSIDERDAKKYRLKTFFPGRLAGQAIRAGLADLIPSRCSRIPDLFKSRSLPIDMAFITVTPPDDMGYMSLSVGVDVARYAVEQASFVVGEINDQMPWAFGDTLVHMDDLDCLVTSSAPPIYVPRWNTLPVFDRIAHYIGSVIEDGDCLSFSIGPLFESLGKRLAAKRQLGVHTPFFTDALMDLVKGGAITNRNKAFFRGKSIAAVAAGTAELMRWIDRNPLVEFQPIDVVMNPQNIGLNKRFIAVIPVRKIDLTGNVDIHLGVGEVAAGTASAQELIEGATLSSNGRTIFALPSRNRRGEANICLSLEGSPQQFSHCDTPDAVATDHGIAYLRGRTIRERAQALIDIAHPDDRPKLLEEAKREGLVYPDQIFLAKSGHIYPRQWDCSHVFKGNIVVHFRAIKPSDEENMRRFFYRLSSWSVYSRYHRPLRTMPHGQVQEYVNIDYDQTMSLVGLIEEVGMERIVAEARYVRSENRLHAETACFVDEAFQRRGIATFLLNLLGRVARGEGVECFIADILADNKPMLKIVKEKITLPIRSVMSDGVYELMITLPTDMADQIKYTGQ